MPYRLMRWPWISMVSPSTTVAWPVRSAAEHGSTRRKALASADPAALVILIMEQIAGLWIGVPRDRRLRARRLQNDRQEPHPRHHPAYNRAYGHWIRALSVEPGSAKMGRSTRGSGVEVCST